MKKIYLTLSLLALIIVSANAVANKEEMCKKGEGLKTFTVRSFNGVLCQIPPIGKWAEKNCAGVDGYEQSKCHKYASRSSKKISSTPATLEQAIEESKVPGSLKGSFNKFKDQVNSSATQQALLESPVRPALPASRPSEGYNYLCIAEECGEGAHGCKVKILSVSTKSGLPYKIGDYAYLPSDKRGEIKQGDILETKTIAVTPRETEFGKLPVIVTPPKKD